MCDLDVPLKIWHQKLEVWYNTYYYSFKVFRRLWLAPIRRLNLHNQLALTIFGRYEKYIPSIGWYIWLERGWLGNSELNKMMLTAIRRQIAKFLTSTRKKCKNTQSILLDGFLNFFLNLKPIKNFMGKRDGRTGMLLLDIKIEPQI